MKRMFVRQLLLTLAMVLLAVLLVGTAFQTLLFSRTVERQKADLRETADAVAEIARIYDGYGSPELALQLSFACRATGEDVLLLDEDGTVRCCSCGILKCEHLGERFDAASLGSDAAASTRAGALYGAKRLAAVCAVPDGGYVIASAEYTEVNAVMRDTVRINLLTVAVVFPVCIAAVWFLIRRQTRPIRRLTEAAKQLGRGDLSVRVSAVGGETSETAELAAAFNNMAQSLEMAETRRSEFIANVSHELKTPMTTISGYMDGMLDGTIPPERQAHYMQIISSEVKRLSRLVRNMLDVSRMKDKGIPAEKKRSFDICGTVGETLLGFERKINEKHIEVEAELPPEGAPAYGDPDAIAQVVYNLTDNAVKFCPEGGTLTVRVEEAQNSRWLIGISNGGPAIPPEELPLLFDRFHKADKSRSGDRDGWGLGLYIVNTILLAHGEDIYVTSRDNLTTFSFTVHKAPV